MKKFKKDDIVLITDSYGSGGLPEVGNLARFIAFDDMPLRNNCPYYVMPFGTNHAIYVDCVHASELLKALG